MKQSSDDDWRAIMCCAVDTMWDTQMSAAAMASVALLQAKDGTQYIQAYSVFV